MYVYVRIKFSSVRAYATHEKANQAREKKKENVKEKEAGGVFPFFFQCSLTESNPSNIFSQLRHDCSSTSIVTK
jgi:hypothetical protein